MYSRLLFLLVFFLINTLCNAQETPKMDAPFGLCGASHLPRLRVEDVDLREAPFRDYGDTYAATKLPKVIADAETIILSFGNDDKLWRIVAISRTYPNDPYGNNVKARYQELARVLSEKYGRGVTHHEIDSQVWKEPNEFVMGIKTGRTMWFTDFNTSALMIEIGIMASGMDQANWRIIFEEKNLRSKFEASKKTKEKNAL